MRLLFGEVLDILFLLCVAPDVVFLVASLAALALFKAAAARAFASGLGSLVVTPAARRASVLALAFFRAAAARALAAALGFFVVLVALP
jgi:hypothetical protein